MRRLGVRSGAILALGVSLGLHQRGPGSCGSNSARTALDFSGSPYSAIIAANRESGQKPSKRTQFFIGWYAMGISRPSIGGKLDQY